MENRIQYRGDGTQTEFYFNFMIFEDSDLEIYFNDELQNGGYVITGAGSREGGKVTFSAPPAVGMLITLSRKMGLSRKSDFQEGGVLRSRVLNYEFDYIVACLQQISDTLERSMTVPVYAEAVNMKLPAPSRGKAILWNDDGSGLCNSAVNVQELDSSLSAALETAAVKAQTATDAAAAASAEAATAAVKAEEATAAAAAANEASATKLETDVSNLSASGRTLLIHQERPDYSRSVDMALTELHTAPCYGYIYFFVCGPINTVSPYGNYLELGSDADHLGQFFVRYVSIPAGGNIGSSLMLPISKGEVFRAIGVTEKHRFIFIPCKGEE